MQSIGLERNVVISRQLELLGLLKLQMVLSLEVLCMHILFN